MSRRLILTLVRKDLTETLRDRRTLFMMVLLPILLYPMVIALFSMVMQSRVESLEERPSRIVIMGELPAGALSEISAAGRIDLEVLPAVDGGEDRFLASARDLVPSRADAAVAVPPDFAGAISSGAAGRLWVYYDSVSDGSARASKRVEAALGHYRDDVLAGREKSLGVPAGFARGVETVSTDVAVPERKSGQLLGSLIPFLLLMMSLMGAFYPAIDLTAGEKERGTVETLLCAPIRPLEMILGKFIAVSLVSMLSALANLLSIGLTGWFLASRMSGELALRWEPAQALLVLAMLVPTIVMMSALFLAIAVLARDFKDGQNLLTPVFTVIVIAASAAIMPGIQLGPWTSFLPVVSMVLLIKEVMVGEASMQMGFAVLVSSGVWAGLALLLAARIFRQEQLLLGGGGSWRSVLAPRRRPDGLPSPSAALLLFALILPSAFYGSMLLSGSTGRPLPVLAVELAGILLPTLLLALSLRFSVRDTFSLRLPPLVAFVPATLIGLTGWVVNSGLVLRLLTPPEGYERMAEKARTSLTSGMSLPLVLLLVAVVPAVQEELAFRGVMLRGLSRLGAPWAIFISAVMFGLAHADIYRLVPVILIGLMNGWIVWRTRSILPAMLVHLLNNGAGVVVGPLLGDGSSSFASPFVDGRWPSWGFVVAAVLVQFAAIMWIAALTRGPRPSPAQAGTAAASASPTAG